MVGAVRTDLQIVGGLAGVGDIVLHPPWAGERAEAILEYITAWGNTAVNILYLTADGPALMGAGAINLPQGTNGGVWVVNGPGTIGLAHAPVGVSSYLRVTPAPSANGQIYVGFYWQKVADFAAPRVLTPPEPTDLEKMDEENETWRRLRQLPPKDFLKQNPGRLTPEQEKHLRELEKLTNMRNQPGRPIK